MSTDAPLTITQDIADLVVQARGFTIRTADDYQAVAGFLIGIKALREKIADTFDQHITRARAAHLALVAEKRAAEQNAVDAEDIAKGLLLAWDEAQSRATAETRTLIDRAQHENRAALEQQAADAESFGEYARADDLRTEAALITPPVLPPSTPKVEGISLRETWTARVVDLTKLVQAAGSQPSLVALLKPDMPRLHAQARSLRGRMAIPGVEAICSKGVAASARTHGEG